MEPTVSLVQVDIQHEVAEAEGASVAVAAAGQVGSGGVIADRAMVLSSSCQLLLSSSSDCQPACRI